MDVRSARVVMCVADSHTVCIILIAAANCPHACMLLLLLRHAAQLDSFRKPKRRRMCRLAQLVPLTHDFRTNGSGLFAELCTMYDAFSDTPCYGLIEALRKHRPDVALVATSRSKNSWVNSMQRNPSAGGHYLLHSLLHTQELSSFRAELKQHNKVRTLSLWSGADCMSAIRYLLINKLGGRNSLSLAMHGWLASAAVCCLWLMVPPQTRSESRLDGLEEVYDNHAALLKKYNVPTIDLTASSAEKFKVLLDSLPETPVCMVSQYFPCLPHRNVGL